MVVRLFLILQLNTMGSIILNLKCIPWIIFTKWEQCHKGNVSSRVTHITGIVM